MKHTRVKIAILTSVLILSAFAMIMIVFNLIMRSNITNSAHNAIDAAWPADSETQTEYDSSAYASFLMTDSNRTLYDAENETLLYKYYSNQEVLIADWCAQHPAVNEFHFASIGSRQYYITQRSLRNSAYNNDGYCLLYVDVTAQQAQIGQMNIALLLVMLLCGAVSCFAGFIMGVHIERGQSRQKKFFENASHELKTPLMAIQGYAEGLETGIVKDNTHAASVILSETEKMATLVDEILCLSRLESGETTLRKEHLRIADLVNDCLAPLEGIIIKRGLRVETNFSNQTAEIEADPAQLERALLNLLSNAVKYADREIVITYTGDQLSVWNDGHHIAPEDLPHIFERFYIGKSGSTGIGLALAKEVIERHGWKLSAQTQANGTCLTIAMRSHGNRGDKNSH